MTEDNEEVDEQASEEETEGQEAPAEEQAAEGAGDEKAEEKAADEGGERKETKTLLSDDEGDGSDDAEPIEYEFTPPEGFEISEEVQARLDHFGEKANDLKLSQDQYQGLLEYELEASQKAMVDQANAYITRVEGWADEVKADKELGGESLEANLGLIKRVTEAYGDKNFMALTGAPSVDNPDGLGIGNNPHFLRFLYRVGKSISDADLIEGDGRKIPQGDSLRKMYPSMFEAAD